MVTATAAQKNFTLEDFMANPPDNMEWVDGQLAEKNGATLKHGKIQSSLGCAWANYMISSKQGGEAYVELLAALTNKFAAPMSLISHPN
jgi:Uma2 family endonuclease